MDTFFTQKTCDRCGGSLAAGRMMSMFNTDCICMICSKKEKHDKDYDAAVKADHEQIRKGNYNFKGIRGSISTRTYITNHSHINQSPYA